MLTFQVFSPAKVYQPHIVVMSCRTLNDHHITAADVQVCNASPAVQVHKGLQVTSKVSVNVRQFYKWTGEDHRPCLQKLHSDLLHGHFILQHTPSWHHMIAEVSDMPAFQIPVAHSIKWLSIRHRMTYYFAVATKTHSITIAPASVSVGVKVLICCTTLGTATCDAYCVESASVRKSSEHESLSNFFTA